MLLRPFVMVALFARIAEAQTPDTTARARGANVAGIVHDSIAHGPLAGAIVQIVDADKVARFSRTAISDSLGRYTIRDVPAGRYMVGFLHAMLDSLGVEAPLREVAVDDRRPVRADLAIPSAARLRAAICGQRSATDSGAVVVGVVRDARSHAPAAGVMVIGEWLELAFRSGGMVRRIPRRVATTGENGWFAMCNVPSGGALALLASRGSDSTGLVEVQVPAEGFLRRDLYLGAARAVVRADTTTRGPLRASGRRVQTGDGRLSGTVVTVAEGKPLVGAQVSITNGPQTRANERGEWTLVDAPVGTRMLEVRAVGYYPDLRRVDVIAGAAPIHIALSTLKAVLDTVRISARRLGYDRDRRGFEERRHTGPGRYLTAADIARRQPIVTSDLFRMLPGVRMDYDSTGVEKQIFVRGSFDWCKPAIYLDGLNLTDRLSADDIDGWVRPDRVAGIEIYTDASVPPQFQQGLNGCGSILIWTK